MNRFKKTWSYILPYFGKYRNRLFLIILLSFIAALFEPFLSFLAKPIVNFLSSDPEKGKKILWLIPVGILVFVITRSAVRFSLKFLMEFLCIKVIRNIQIALYEHFLFLSLDHYEKTSTGEMMARTVNDVGHMQMIVPLTIDAFHQLFRLTGLAAVCFYREPVLSLIMFTTFPLVLVLVIRAAAVMKRYTKKGLSKIADITRIMQETYSGSRVVKSFSREADEVERYAGEVEQFIGIQYKFIAVKHLISPLTEIAVAFVLAPIVYYLFRKVLYQGVDTAGDIVSYVLAVVFMFQPVKKLGEIFGTFNSAYGAAERIRETFEKQSTVREPDNPIELPPLRDMIRFENVSFRHFQDWVVRDVSFEATQGKLVAIVGRSGSGKTTLVNLLCRFYDVDTGRILIDGIDIRKASLKSLRNQMGVVTQDTFLFNTSVMENILYGAPWKSRNDAMEAATSANAHEFIMKLPQQYDSMIGERGVKLSGGERQRIAIARAILRNPPVLVLDEATAALDTASEREVQKALDILMKNRTTIAIAHRFSTIRNADTILVLKDGQIVERGTHSELMKKEGEYRQLYEMQSTC